MVSSAETQGHGSLEEIAMLALEFGRLLMEAGASAYDVDEICPQVAVGLGAERIDLRVGYASLAITIGIGPHGITRMRKVGPLGVNQSLAHALRTAAARIERGDFTRGEARVELDRLLALIRNSASRQDAKIAKTHDTNLGTEGKRPTAPGNSHPIWVIP